MVWYNPWPQDPYLRVLVTALNMIQYSGLFEISLLVFSPTFRSVLMTATPLLDHQVSWAREVKRTNVLAGFLLMLTRYVLWDERNDWALFLFPALGVLALMQSHVIERNASILVPKSQDELFALINVSAVGILFAVFGSPGFLWSLALLGVYVGFRWGVLFGFLCVEQVILTSWDRTHFPALVKWNLRKPQRVDLLVFTLIAVAALIPFVLCWTLSHLEDFPLRDQLNASVLLLLGVGPFHLVMFKRAFRITDLFIS
jgi:hypothetical protein